MQSSINLSILTALTLLASAALAQNPAATPESTSPADTKAGAVPSFPYLAKITSSDVLVRSGPGTNYYPCGRLNKGDKVEVVSSRFSWSRIVPPPGSFSWISTHYVTTDPNNPSTGTVTGDNVRVYVGSPYRELIHSTTLDYKLTKGDKVRLLGEQKDNYYKIAPPTGAYRWVSTKYTRPATPAESVTVSPPKKVAPPVVAPPADTGTPAGKPVTPKISVEPDSLKEYYALEKQIKAERAKPVARQDYTSIKQALLKIAGNKKAGKAARYSQFTLKRVERFELALDVAKTVRLQDTQLQQIQGRIDKARATRLAEAQHLGRFAAVGRFQTSNIFSTQPDAIHYRIIDDTGKTLCYAAPTGRASRMNLTRLIGRRVGLVGKIEPHPQTEGALVRFNAIVELK